MNTFIKKTILFVFAVIFVFVGGILILSKYVERNTFQNYETEGNLLMLKENEHYDIAFTGISHARNFTRHKNQARVEQILHKKTLNLAIGNGVCGVNDLLFYLQYFETKEVTYDTLLYVLSPPLLFGDYLNTATNTFQKEPFRFDFFYQYTQYTAENKSQRLFEYLRSKLRWKWIKTQPYSLDRKIDALAHYDAKKVKEGLKLAYPYLEKNKDKSIQNKNFKTVEQTIEWAKKEGIEIIFMIPPAVFGKWKKHDETITFCQQMKQKYNCDYYDFSESVLQVKYYYDHHHLNSNGVEYFTEKYLLPILK